MSEYIQNYSVPLGKHDTQIVQIGSIFVLNHQFLVSVSSEGVVNLFDTSSQQIVVQVLLLNNDLQMDNDNLACPTRVVNTLAERNVSYTKRINRDSITVVFMDLVDRSMPNLTQKGLSSEHNKSIDINIQFYVGQEQGIISLFKFNLTKQIINVEDISHVKNRKIQPLVSFVSHSKSVCMLKHFCNYENKQKNFNKSKEKEKESVDDIEKDKDLTSKDNKINKDVNNNNLKLKESKDITKSNHKDKQKSNEKEREAKDEVKDSNQDTAEFNSAPDTSNVKSSHNNIDQLVSTSYDKLLNVQIIDRENPAEIKLVYKYEMPTLITDMIPFQHFSDNKQYTLKQMLATCQDGSLRYFNMKNIDFKNLKVTDQANIVNFPLNKIQRYEYKTDGRLDKKASKPFLEEQNVAMLIGDTSNIILYEVDRKQTLIMSAHSMNIKGACFDDNFCMTQGEDSFIKIWEMNTFRLCEEMKCHSDTINQVEVCNAHLYSGGADQQVMLLDQDELIEKQHNFKEMEQEEIQCKAWNKKTNLHDKTRKNKKETTSKKKQKK